MARRKTFNEITKEIKDIIRFLDTLNEKIMEARRNSVMSELAKRVVEMVKVQHILLYAPRASEGDGKIPPEGGSYDTVGMRNGMEAGHPIMYCDPHADGPARSPHWPALIIGTDICFRKSAHRFETEEVRNGESSEPTYAALRESHPPADDRAEEEAVAWEEERLPGTWETAVRGMERRLTEPQRRTLMRRLKAEVEDELSWREATMRPDEYERLMRAYRRREERGELPWQADAPLRKK